MRVHLFLGVMIIHLSFCSAIQITEIEINPLEGRSGIEWIEIHSGEELDISNWEIWDGLTNPKKRYAFGEVEFIDEGEFKIIEFSSSVLNNGGDFLIFYDSEGNEILRTLELSEKSSGENTWQFCEEWEFKEPTKGKENVCGKEEEIVFEELVDEEEDILVEKIALEEKTSENIPKEIKITRKAEPIILEQKDTFEEDTSTEHKDLKKYIWIVFCVLLGFLFLREKKKSYKTEFQNG